jgi:hypothetical protein
MTEPSSYFLLTDIFDETDKFLLNYQVTTLGQAVSSALNSPLLNFPIIKLQLWDKQFLQL